VVVLNWQHYPDKYLIVIKCRLVLSLFVACYLQAFDRSGELWLVRSCRTTPVECDPTAIRCWSNCTQEWSICDNQSSPSSLRRSYDDLTTTSGRPVGRGSDMARDCDLLATCDIWHVR